MNRIARAILLSVTMVAVGGCGGTGALDGGSKPPHDGELITIPGGKGYVEVITKKASSPKTPLDGELTFYFLKDASTPRSPAPSTGTLKVGKSEVTLASQGDALVTPKGPPLLQKGTLDGRLKVDLDGQTVNIPLGVR
jgi:hypothetical protein